MMKQQLRWVILIAAGLVGAHACGSSSPTGPGSGAVTGFRFSHLPVARSTNPTNLSFGVTPLGYRTIGTDSIRTYLDFHSTVSGADGPAVFAPAGGTVSAVAQGVGNARGRLDVNAPGGFRYYLTGYGLTFSVAPGLLLTAGQVVGQRSGSFGQGYSGVGLGLIHPTIPQAFVAPDRYKDELLFAASPVDYYDEPNRSLITGGFNPAAATGELNFDIPGRLQGFWYLPSVPRAESTSLSHSTGWLWFLKTMNAQTLGLGGTSVYAVSPDGRATTYFFDAGTGPAPGSISVASGMVDYRFPYSSTNAVVIRVQMLTDTSVRAETFDTYSGSPAGFTANAKMFFR